MKMREIALYRDPTNNFFSPGEDAPRTPPQKRSCVFGARVVPLRSLNSLAMPLGVIIKLCIGGRATKMMENTFVILWYMEGDTWP